MAKPSPASTPPRLLVLELWGLGDLALAVPFLRAASDTMAVTVVAKPHAAEVLRRFAPAARHIAVDVPWTAFRGKYRLLHWPWRALARTVRELRQIDFDLAVSARPDPRDHALLWLAGARRRIGYPRAGSGILLTEPLAEPSDPHRAAHWQQIAASLGLTVPAVAPPRTNRGAESPAYPGSRVTPLPRGGRIVLHEGAAQPVRRWPRSRFDALADRLVAAGYDVVRLTEEAPLSDTALLDLLASADRFVGNDSGPGHLAALAGVPTFTLFGPQRAERFHPQHPQAAWMEGGPCAYKPCKDHCRYAEPHCILAHTVEDVWTRVQAWLEGTSDQRSAVSVQPPT